jgi:hypothetical protein
MADSSYGEAVVNGNTLVGGETDAAPDSMFEKSSTPYCYKNCSGDCGAYTWEDSQFSSKKCQQTAKSQCDSIWAPAGKSVTGSWVTSASTGTAVCNKGTPCQGNSTGGRISCRGKAADWLVPNVPPSYDQDAAILANIQKHDTHFPDDVDGRNVLMRLFCTGAADTRKTPCLPRTDPITGIVAPQAACSRYSVTGDSGNACRSWVASLSQDQAVKLYQSVTVEHCSKPENAQASECACINASLQDRNYVEVSARTDAPDYCWYLPCKKDSTVFVKPDEFAAKCPDSCVQIIDAEKGAGITASAFIQTQDCGGGGGGGGKALLLAVTAGVIVLVVGLLLAKFLAK